MNKYPTGNRDAYRAIENSAKDFTYLMIDALAKASIENGMDAQASYKTAVQLVLGSAKMINKSSIHPWELIDMVCSPGGTTIEGVAILQKNAFEATINNLFDEKMQ